MKYNFDLVIDRRNSDSHKWNSVSSMFGAPDVLPLSVADMDFQAPPDVIRAVHESADFGVFGYSLARQDYYEAIIGWVKRRFDWSIEREWIGDSPNVIVSLMNIIRSFTKPGNKILIQPPVYQSFEAQIKENGRQVEYNPLIFRDGKYEMDFADLERKAQDPDVKMIILCSPHNPVGRVWNVDELKRLGDICLDNDVLVVTDEIHWDFVYEGHRHVPFASINERFAYNSITCISTGKSFNMAGMLLSHVIIKNEQIRKTFQNKMYSEFHFRLMPTVSIAAVKAAFNHGDHWMDELVKYIRGNFAYMAEYLKQRMPKIELIWPEGTYLAWLNCRALGMTSEQLQQWLIKEAKLGVFEGSRFGPGGEGFVRINLACPQATVKECLQRLEMAYRSLPL